MAAEWRAVLLGLLTVLAALPGKAQAGYEFDLKVPDGATQKFVSSARVVQGFNEIGTQAVELRRGMTRRDAEAFDAVMLDVMSALTALPYVRMVNSPPVGLVPDRPRYDRVPQLEPDLRALERFFARLQGTATSPAEARLFARSRKSVRKMLAGLPEIMPTLAAKSAAAPRQQ